MDHDRLVGCGVEVSQLRLGTWMFATEADDGTVATDRAEAHDVLDEAWDRGVHLLDTANSYGDSERYMGEWLADHDREEFVVASKVYWTTRGRRHVPRPRRLPCRPQRRVRSVLRPGVERARGRPRGGRWTSRA